MPSLSFLKHPRSESQVGEVEHDNTEKVQRRQSLFRRLLKRSSNKRKSGQTMTSHSSSIASPKSPLPPGMNKPLPPPPPPGSESDQPVAPPRSPLKLARIISPIALPELHQIFSGAPQFFARSEGHHTGAPHPSIAFPWDVEVKIRDLCDHVQIQDDAWGCVTAWPHITYHVSKNPQALKEHHEKTRAHFLPRCRERPNMLSMQGKERGTTGYQAALEMGVADALEIPDESTDSNPETISEQRRKFLNGKDGLRPITDSTLTEKLLEVSEVYHSDPLQHRRPTVELYTELFTQLLFPPSRVIDSDDPYSLQVQIEALVSALAAPTVWVDFSSIEWRIRLGQILWGPSSETEQDQIAINNEVISDSTDQKYWLLLQILLSCELLVRLDAISMNVEHGKDPVKIGEIQRFEKTATTSVKWSLILARSWLENIRIEKPNQYLMEEKKPAGWLATLTGATTSEAPPIEGIGSLQFYGRHQARQLNGLVHFARRIGWPDIDDLTSKISANDIKISDVSVQSTPAGTSLSFSTQQSSSYFSNRRPRYRRGLSSHKNVSAIMHPDGWLSNSFLSGLILPGEGLSHFLISTLLENDPAAVEKLGEQANLYGGFVYRQKSFWSTSCIVGRILAAAKGATECMGWISSNVLPRGAKEGWVDLDVEYPLFDNRDAKTGKPRLWQKTAIEHDGNVIGGADSSSVLPGDFIQPMDECTQPPISVTFESLDLFAADDSLEPTPSDDSITLSTDRTGRADLPSIQTYSGMMRFSVELDEEGRKEIDVAISHDVQFVTAHPCVPPPLNDILKSPTSPSFQTLELTPGTATFSMASRGHPLHKAFTYTTISLSTLISTPSKTPFSSLVSTPVSPPKTADTSSSAHTTNSTIPRVLVIDCTDITMVDFPKRPMASPNSGVGSAKSHHFGSDLEMLVRALCAERGWNVLISRRGRGCIACAIREASALGWRVVIRVA